MSKKFLDLEGVKTLWGLISLKDYPNNETLVNVIDAIDETKADKSAVIGLTDYVDELVLPLQTAVLYSEQILSKSEKAQVRKNLDLEELQIVEASNEEITALFNQ